MKRIALFICICSMLVNISCAQSEDIGIADVAGGGSVPEKINPEKILTVYITRTQNTKAVATIVHELVGGDIIQLQPRDPYPENYQEMVAQAQREREANYLPPLLTTIDNIDSYDIIFVGFPVWGMTLPTPMKSFLSQYNLNGKTIIPFCTNGGYGAGDSFVTVRQYAPNSNIIDGLSIRGGSERDGIFFVMEGDREVQAREQIQNWLQRIQIISNIVE